MHHVMYASIFMMKLMFLGAQTSHNHVNYRQLSHLMSVSRVISYHGKRYIYIHLDCKIVCSTLVHITPI